uniref:Uncharacterized protein n=1 Tax=Anguilla anguilla TaxID=7936 RepID=A0A0E9T9K3_ANGAN
MARSEATHNTATITTKPPASEVPRAQCPLST